MMAPTLSPAVFWNKLLIEKFHRRIPLAPTNRLHYLMYQRLVFMLLKDYYEMLFRKVVSCLLLGKKASFTDMRHHVVLHEPGPFLN